MKPTTEQINKLPKWAQEYISTIERERESAVLQLNEFVDSQTPSAMYVDEHVCTGEESGPSTKRHYVQGYKLSIDHADVHLEILLARKDDSQREFGIELQYSSKNRWTGGHVALIPKSFQTVELVAKENMR